MTGQTSLTTGQRTMRQVGIMKPKTMDRRHRGGLSVMMVTLILTLAVILGSGSPATAADLPNCEALELAAGLACDFALCLESVGGNQVMKEFRDENGNLVRIISAGRGAVLSFTNLSTGATLSLTTGGSVSQTTFNPDGSKTVTNTGHNVVIFFPTDDPPGPSTTLYQGRLVYIDDNGVFTLQTFSGRTTDICAALSD
jgi:hypothetical protein